MAHRAAERILAGHKPASYWLDVDDEKWGPGEYDPVVEAEIDWAYKILEPNEGPNSDDDWNDETGLYLPNKQKPKPGEEVGTKKEVPPVHVHVAKPGEPVVSHYAPTQMELLAETKTPHVFLTVHRMFTSFEFQLWDVIPISTVKELIEDITEVPPENMRIYQKDGTLLEDSKLLKDYGITPEINHLRHPAHLWVGFLVDLEEADNEEGEDGEEEDDDTDNEISPGLEYYETVADIDFSEEIERDRTQFDIEEEVDFGPGYVITPPETNCIRMPKKKDPDDWRKVDPEELVENVDSDFDFVPFTLHPSLNKIEEETEETH